MTDLRGVETHGVSNMLRTYVQRLPGGQARPPARLAARARDARHRGDRRGARLGIMVGPKAMRLAIEKARHGGRRRGDRAQQRALRRDRPLRHAGRAAGHGRRLLHRGGPRTWCPPSAPSRCSAPIPSRSPPPRAARRRCSSTSRPPPSRATRSAWPCASARRSCRAGSPTRTAPRSWRRSPSSTATSSSRRRSAARASRARTRATASPSWPRSWPPCWPARCPPCWRPAAAPRTTSPRTASRPSPTSSGSRTRWTRCSRPCGRRRPRRARSACSIPGCPRPRRSTQRRAHGIPLHKEVIEWFASVTGEMGLAPLATL